MDKYKKFMYIGIFILLISLVGSAGTYAWFTWISPSNTNVTLSIGTLADVTFTSGPDINISNLAPVYNYTDGVSTTFTIRNANSTDSLLYKVKLEITSIANELKDESFKYTLVKDNKVVKTGNLKDTVNGNTLILNTSSLDKGSTSSPKISTFKLYFWIDGNMENNSNMMNKSLVGKIDVGVETNVLTNTESSISSTSKFLNSEIERQNITTLKVVDNLDIPEDATVVDVSKNSDNTIKMWYKEADENGNYNVTIGSNNKIYANPSSTSGLFSNLTNVTSIDLSNIDTSGVTSMYNMFGGDSSLTNITFGDNFNTSNVTNIGNMFDGCTNLPSLDLSMFDTSKVTNLSSTFRYCGELTNLNLSSFDTSEVSNMNWLFYGCHKLTSLDLSNFNTSNVTDMYWTFVGCSSLTSLDLSNFDTSKVKTGQGMFMACSSLISLDLSNFDTSKMTSMNAMFRDCSSLTSLDLSNFDTSNVTNMEFMFLNCSSLASLDLSSFDTSKVTSMIGMFSACTSLTSLDLSNFNTSKVTKMGNNFGYGGMFQNCSSLTSLDLSNFDMSNVTDMTNMFRYTDNLKVIYVSDLWNVSGVTSSNNMFTGCSSLKGAVSYDSSKVDASMANYTNGYLTYKKKG